MASVRVESLNLRLAAPAAMQGSRVALVRQAQDDFVPSVLAAMQRRLERAYGPRAVILIRRLSFRCALKPSAQDVEALAELLGEDLAGQVQLMAVRERGTGALPQPAAAVQVYRDADHHEAAVLIAAAERRFGPDGDKHDFGRLWRKLARRPAGAVAAVLARCLLARRLEAVLARLPQAELESLWVRVETAAPAAVTRAVRRMLERRAGEPASPGRPGRPAAETKPAIRAARSPRQDRPGPFRDRRAVAPEPDGESEPHPETLPDAPPPPAPSAAQEDLEAAVIGRASPAEPGNAEARPLARDPDAPEPHPEAPADTGPPDEPPESEPAETPQFAAFESRWCALLYMLNISRALEAPERLWQVGADEGDVLAAMLARLASEDGDAASGVLSRRFPEPPGPVPTFHDWAREELVGDVRRAAEKLTAPTTTAEALGARIAAFEAWFGKGAQDVAGWLAACHLAVFEAMTGAAVAPGALAERLGVHGRIELDADVIRVVMPLEAIDLDVRRAGLDADPGWLAWLNRRMVFVFEDDAP